ncbi:MAG: hypothetical protein ACRDGT_01620 [Candidatus Limnocylindria bacterium]
MAGALRPAVLLILVASVLFLVDGYLDGVYPGGPHGSLDAYSGLGWTSYLFAVANAVVAVLIARGSERMLALRIGLAAFFIFERPVSAVALGVKPVESIAVHLLTALVETLILASTLRVWRLGHSYTETDMSLLTLPAAATAGAPGGAESYAVVEPVSEARGRGRSFRLPRFGRGKAAEPVTEPAPKVREPMATRIRTISRGMTWALGLLSLLLAAALVADGAAAGVVPGVSVDLASSAWLVYVFALVLLIVASRAVHGGRFAIRLLLVVALIYFMERAFTPFALRIAEPVSLALHLLGALMALALALVSAAALRASSRAAQPPSPA